MNRRFLKLSVLCALTLALVVCFGALTVSADETADNVQRDGDAWDEAEEFIASLKTRTSVNKVKLLLQQLYQRLLLCSYLVLPV